MSGGAILAKKIQVFYIRWLRHPVIARHSLFSFGSGMSACVYLAQILSVISYYFIYSVLFYNNILTHITGVIGHDGGPPLQQFYDEFFRFPQHPPRVGYV